MTTTNILHRIADGKMYSMSNRKSVDKNSWRRKTKNLKIKNIIKRYKT
jgi:hypothetical protein